MPSPSICHMCMGDAQARAGQSLTMVEPFLTFAMQKAVANAGAHPMKKAIGFCAPPVDIRTFRAIHHMLVSQLIVPGPGQGISMDRYGKPVQISGLRSGPVRFGFDVVLTEVVASITSERSWLGRVGKRDGAKCVCGPVYHHLDGCIGCVAAPLQFQWRGAAPCGGTKADRMQVKHAYFVLDMGGEFRGMGSTNTRDEEAAVSNRVMLCTHANKLRSRGAVFTDEQNRTIDLYLQAVLASIPPLPHESDNEDDTVGGTTDNEDA